MKVLNFVAQVMLGIVYGIYLAWFAPEDKRQEVLARVKSRRQPAISAMLPDSCQTQALPPARTKIATIDWIQTTEIADIQAPSLIEIAKIRTANYSLGLKQLKKLASDRNVNVTGNKSRIASFVQALQDDDKVRLATLMSA